MGENGHKEYELLYRGKEPAGEVLANTPASRLNKVRAWRAEEGWANKLIHGDNLAALKALLDMKEKGLIRNGDGSTGARLVYIDPPFSTKLKFRGKKDQRAYDDKLSGASFIEFLRKRLILIRELMAEDGSIYVHLDWKKAHYVKAIMDEVFGEENFLNDIIWSYGGRGAKAIATQFSRNHDIILWYEKGGGHVFNQAANEKRIRKGTAGYKMDEDGRWFKTSPRGDYTDESIAALAKENRVYRTKNGTIRIKYFLKDDGDYIIEDKLIGDVWGDIPDAMHLSNIEKTGYPTQKPEALLYRIIGASSNPGDIVFDAFAGAGTTLAAAEKLGRRWIGVDSGKLSIHTIEKRLLKIYGTKDAQNPAARYGKACAPFEVFRDGDAATEASMLSPEVVTDFDPYGAKGPALNLKGFTSREGKGGLEDLSSLMTGYEDNGVFNVMAVHAREELEAKGFSLSLSSEKEASFVYCDIFGNERVEAVPKFTGQTTA